MTEDVCRVCEEWQQLFETEHAVNQQLGRVLDAILPILRRREDDETLQRVLKTLESLVAELLRPLPSRPH
jgi:flagellar biosynthesis/type III secretory pathway chaperone